MTSSALSYVPFDRSAAAPNVVVDGSANPGTVLVLSHWPRTPIPDGCVADTSTQMAFRYLDRGADLHAGATAVTNNHFDQDGLAGIYALVDPDHALRHRSRLEQLAAAGDFGVTDDRSAARLSMAVAALASPGRSPLGALPDDHDARCGVLYAAALDRLPSWLEDPERCRQLWEDEDAQLDAGLSAIASGAVGIEEHVDLDLAVVTLPSSGHSSGHRFFHRTFAGVHPIALHGATARSTVLMLDPHEGRHHLTCRYEGWVQFRSREIRRRVDLRPLADRLTEMESDVATWTATPPDDLTPELLTSADGPPSSLTQSELVNAVTDHLRSAPPAWDPYLVRSPSLSDVDG